jgi:hypothetical protein
LEELLENDFYEVVLVHEVVEVVVVVEVVDWSGKRKRRKSH